MLVKQLDFTPPLNSRIPIQIDASSGFIMEPRLRWRATLRWEEYDTLRDTQGEVQVWSKCTGGDWFATPFKMCTTAKAFDKDAECVDFSLFECNAETTDDQVSLEASIPLPLLAGGIVSVEFTYRVEYASGGCIRWDWAGTHGTNGEFVVSSTQADGSQNWIDRGDGAFHWARKPMVIAKLSNDAKWSGWAYKKDSTGVMVFDRFTEVTSESVTGPIYALALLPQANPEACVVYSPVLYTVQNGALLLEDDDLVLRPEGGELSLNAYASTLTWKDHIPYKPTLLDTETSDFLAVSHKSQVNVGHLQFLPTTGSQSIITLTLSDIASLFPSSVVLFDSTLRTIKFLPALSLAEHLRIAVGPAGGEILIVPAYHLSASISVALLHHNPGSIVELEGNDIPPSKGHPQQGFFSLAVRVIQRLLDLLLSSMSTRLSNVSVIESVVSAPQDVSTATPSKLVFKLKGKASLFVKGEDISKLLILVGGEPLQMTPKDIGGGQWLIEATGELETDFPERRVEILLRE